jgi:flagellum-specific ATP synthase
MATYARSEDMINIGAYVKGSSPDIDRSIELRPRVERFLRQPMDLSVSLGEARKDLLKVVG